MKSPPHRLSSQKVLVAADNKINKSSSSIKMYRNMALSRIFCRIAKGSVKITLVNSSFIIIEFRQIRKQLTFLTYIFNSALLKLIAKNPSLAMFDFQANFLVFLKFSKSCLKFMKEKNFTCGK